MTPEFVRGLIERACAPMEDADVHQSLMEVMCTPFGVAAMDQEQQLRVVFDYYDVGALVGLQLSGHSSTDYGRFFQRAARLTSFSEHKEALLLIVGQNVMPNAKRTVTEVCPALRPLSTLSIAVCIIVGFVAWGKIPDLFNLQPKPHAE